MWNFKKWHIFDTQRDVFGPKNGISPKSLKLPQNKFITSLQTKNGDIWWRNTPCTEKNVKFQEIAYFRYTARRFLSQKWDFAKIVKTSTRQLYNKPTNQKWQGLVKKRTLYYPKTERSRDGGRDGGTDGHAHSNTPSAFYRGVKKLTEKLQATLRFIKWINDENIMNDKSNKYWAYIQWKVRD